MAGGIVLLTADGMQHRYVAATLSRLPELSAIVITEQPRPPFRRRIARAIRRFGLAGVLSRALLKIALSLSGESARRRADLTRVLGSPEFPAGVPVYRTGGVNSSQTRDVLHDLSPEIICVYGTYVVKDSVLGLANKLSLNLHTGISPYYRGADCEFWPIHNGEPGLVGATVHVCTERLDAGPVFGTAVAKLEANDGLGAVFGRCVIAGAELYRSICKELIAGRHLPAIPQDLSAGREYKVAERGWIAEARVTRAIRRGIIRNYLSGTGKK